MNDELFNKLKQSIQKSEEIRRRENMTDKLSEYIKQRKEEALFGDGNYWADAEELEEWEKLAVALEQQIVRLDYVIAAIEGHDIEMLRGMVTRLKQSDGEGWAVGKMLERTLAL